MAFTYIGSVGASGDLDTVTTAGVNTTGAKIILISASYYVAGTLPITITDSKGNTWIPLTEQIGGLNIIISRIYYCINPTIGVGHTFTGAGVGSYTAIQVSYFSSIGTPTYDTQNSSIIFSTFTSQGCSITPANNDSLIFSSCVTWQGKSPIIVNSGFAIGSSNEYDGTTTFMNANAYLIQGTASLVTPEFTWTTATNDEAQTIASFYEVSTVTQNSNFFNFF